MTQRHTSIPKGTKVLLDRVERGLASRHPDPYPLSASLAFYRLVQRNPIPLWQLIARWGDIPNEPVREVVLDCLRGVLSHWYDRFIARAERLAARKPRFATVLVETLEIILPYYRVTEARKLGPPSARHECEKAR
jgi:hypothetical protein